MARILHLGVGNFHRAHQAWYTAHAGDDWHITGVVMRNTTLFQAMRAGADIIVMVHPDYQYDPTLLPEIIHP
ncbi:MAG: hypothetical protein COB65_08720, partial [Thalassobium sp.]